MRFRSLIIGMAGATVLVAPAIAGPFGGKKWVEKLQEVQVEYDYSPTVGRQPEPSPEPFVPTRYLTPEQRAEPIIVEPAPVYIQDAEAERDNSSAPTAPTNVAPADLGVTVPSYITSVPTASTEAPSMELMPAGSATGSKAYADYGPR